MLRKHYRDELDTGQVKPRPKSREPVPQGGWWRPPRPAGSRSISRPSDRSTEPASGLGPFGSRSLRQEPSAATQASTREQSGLEPSLACVLHQAAASTYTTSRSE